MTCTLERAVLWTVCCLGPACAQHGHASSTTVGSTARIPEAPDAAPTAEAASPVGPQELNWLEAVRRERWDDAARELELLGDADKARPEMLYVRARVAIERGDQKSALTLLDGLEMALPLIAQDVARHRAEAKLAVGPYVEAAEYFASRAPPSSALKAAEGFERAKDFVRARGQCDRVVANENRTRLQEAEARACRARLGDKRDSGVVADARWITVHAPDSPFDKDAEALVARIDPSHPLTGQELMTRAKALADAGRTDEAVRVLDHVPSAPAPRVSRLDELREKAETLYRGHGRNLEAARVLEECAAAGGAHAAEDAFHAARALSRADRDDEAVQRMTTLARVHAGTRWGDEAQFFVPYLHLLHGKWKDAASGFDEYAQKYPNGVERRDALRDRAIAHLMTRDYRVARKLFEQLAADEPDALNAARAQTMAALCALRDGDRLLAVGRWSDTIRQSPLSWPALVATARLVEAGASVPPTIEPAETAPALEPLSILLPPPVDMLHRVGLDADAESALRERESLVAARAPAGRGLEALCAAYGELGRGKRRYQLTQQIPSSMFATAPNARSRWAWECAYATPFEDDVGERAQTERLDPWLAYGVMRQESNFDPEAVSPAHAVGLMQLLPETARTVAQSLGTTYEDALLTVPSFNIALGIHYLRQLGDKFHDQLPLLIAAYNAGDEAISRWVLRAAGMDIDVFIERIPYAETRAYVAKVMAHYAHYAFLKKGEGGVPRLTLTPWEENAEEALIDHSTRARARHRLEAGAGPVEHGQGVWAAASRRRCNPHKSGRCANNRTPCWGSSSLLCSSR